jgi:hypothetical protein
LTCFIPPSDDPLSVGSFIHQPLGAASEKLGMTHVADKTS